MSKAQNILLETAEAVKQAANLAPGRPTTLSGLTLRNGIGFNAQGHQCVILANVFSQFRLGK